MKIAIFFEHENIEEIGDGNKYRVKSLTSNLISSGHKVEFIGSGHNFDDTDIDILIIDHLKSQQQLIKNAKEKGIKIVLIDGSEKDVDIVDLSISAFFNKRSNYKGADYIVFPTIDDKYTFRNSVNSVFIGMGGFDKNNYASIAIKAVCDLGLSAFVANGINGYNFSDKNNVFLFYGENFYNAMKYCDIAITNGGMPMFQALYYGMPTIAIPQHDNHKLNIDGFMKKCVLAEPDIHDIYDKLDILFRDNNIRKSLSMEAGRTLGGNGIFRICDLICDLEK